MFLLYGNVNIVDKVVIEETERDMRPSIYSCEDGLFPKIAAF